MKMKRCTAAILLMLSLEALVAGRLSATVADDGVDTILLPSDGNSVGNGVGDGVPNGPGVAGHGDEGTAAVAWPWQRCCPHGGDAHCRARWPPCDYVRNGGPGVAVQEATAAATEGPRLLNETGHDATGKAEAASEKIVADGEEQARPWKCCDLPRCTKSFPPICQCLDKVKKCAKTCKVCEKAVGSSNGASSHYVCRDWYGGWAGPSCTKRVATDGRRGN